MSVSRAPAPSPWRAPVLLAGVLLGALLGSGCVHTSSFQDADTVPAGQHEIGVAVVSAETTVRDTDRPRLDIIEYWPTFTAWGRMGVAERLELHGMVWLLGATVGAKYQLVGHGQDTGPAVSLGVDLALAAPPPELCILGCSGPQATSVSDLVVPLYLGYKIAPDIGVYAHPKYMFRRVGGLDIAEHYAGGTAGFTVGPAPGGRGRFYVEATAMSELEGREIIYTVGLGLGARSAR
jgi:hypothetical protein